MGAVGERLSISKLSAAIEDAADMVSTAHATKKQVTDPTFVESVITWEYRLLMRSDFCGENGDDL